MALCPAPEQTAPARAPKPTPLNIEPDVLNIEPNAPAPVEDVGEATCLPPEATPGSYRWVRTHAFFATDTGLVCPDCGLAWPEKVRS